MAEVEQSAFSNLALRDASAYSEHRGKVWSPDSGKRLGCMPAVCSKQSILDNEPVS